MSVEVDGDAFLDFDSAGLYGVLIQSDDNVIVFAVVAVQGVHRRLQAGVVLGSAVNGQGHDLGGRGIELSGHRQVGGNVGDLIVGVFLAGSVRPLAVEGVGIGFVRSLGGSRTGIGRRAVFPAGDGLQHGVAVLEGHGVCRLERVPAVFTGNQLLTRRVGNGSAALILFRALGALVLTAGEVDDGLSILVGITIA